MFPKTCFRCGMLIHETNACLRLTLARDEDGRLKFEMWLKDTGVLQTPLPVPVISPPVSSPQDPIDGTLGAIVSHTYVRHSPHQEGPSNNLKGYANMQGNTYGFGVTTQNFSNDVMQYIGTEFEAMARNSSTSLGSWLWIVSGMSLRVRSRWLMMA